MRMDVESDREIAAGPLADEEAGANPTAGDDAGITEVTEGSEPSTEPDAEGGRGGDAEYGDGDETEDDPGGDRGNRPRGRTPRGVQKRIDELVRRGHEQQRAAETAAEEAEYWKKKALEGEGAGDGNFDDGEGADDNRPGPEMFNTYDEYVEALTDWKAGESLRAREEMETRMARVAKAAKAERAFAARVEAARERHPDFDEAVFREPSEGGPVVTEAMFEAIRASEAGPEIAYHLARNPGLSYRLAEMHPAAAARELGRIEAVMEADGFNGQRSGNRISKAPDPISPVTGRGVQAEKNPSKMSNEEYRAWRRKQGA